MAKQNLLRETASPMTLLSVGDSPADRESETMRGRDGAGGDRRRREGGGREEGKRGKGRGRTIGVLTQRLKRASTV